MFPGPMLITKTASHMATIKEERIEEATKRNRTEEKAKRRLRKASLQW